MKFVRTHHSGLGRETTIYLPGSSLKGTLRSYCERVARTVGLFCCYPHDHNEHSPMCFCGKKHEKEEDGARGYNLSCTACRLFGNTILGSRLFISDAYPTPETVAEANRTEQRDGVAIDRLAGAVAVGPFTLEVVTRGEFEATLSLENFELWQLGLLAIGLRDLGSGLCPIGHSKSRGLGRMEVELTKLEVGYPGRFAPQERGFDFATNIYPIFVFDFPGKADYQFKEEEPLALEGLGKLVEEGDYGRVAVAFTGDGLVWKVLKKAVPYWKAYVEKHQEE
jgi:CRISPR-associated RAMP protein (TIGR02581 family)